MNRLVEFATTAIAGAVGSAIVVLVLDASLLIVLPITIGIGAIFLAAGSPSRPRELDPERQPQGV